MGVRRDRDGLQIDWRGERVCHGIIGRAGRNVQAAQAPEGGRELEGGEFARGRFAGEVNADSGCLPLDLAVGMEMSLEDEIGIGGKVEGKLRWQLDRFAPDGPAAE